ncbi:hypothetical protein [Salinicoccus bachuensis]|uniref:Uncharacterized protein n=1 Tax=Salinicoccus bachuensis TaxID=3136731 RepID=A0ABZ3CGA3_9STAP
MNIDRIFRMVHTININIEGGDGMKKIISAVVVSTILLGSFSAVNTPTAEASVVKSGYEEVGTFGKGSGYLPDGRPAPINVY